MSDTYLNGEVTALKQARAKAQETINRLDRALAILDGAEAAGASPLLVSGAVLPDRKGRAVAEYRRASPPARWQRVTASRPPRSTSGSRRLASPSTASHTHTRGT